MRVTLMLIDKMIAINLPKVIEGRYWFTDDDNDNKLLAVEANEDKSDWVIKSTLTATLYDSSRKEVNEILLRGYGFNYVKFGSLNEAIIFVEEEDRENDIFEKYSFERNGFFTIGRDSRCDISIDNEFISSHYASISFTEGKWKLEGNANTIIYVDGRRFNNTNVIKFGSIIYIFGISIIVGGGFIAINNRNRVILSKDKFTKLCINNDVDDKEVEIKEDEYFYRSPRFMEKIEPLELKVDMPTQAERLDDTPILLTLAPSMIMGVASFSTGLITLVNTLNNNGNLISVLPTLIMSISMLAGMIVFPFIMKKRDAKHKKRREEHRRVQYTKYLSQLRQEVEKHKGKQRKIHLDNNPLITDRIRQENFWKSGLWCKNKNDSDYLFIRLGVGDIPMAQNIVYPQEKFTLEDDEMRDALFRFQAEEKLLKDVPIGIDLLNTRCIGIVGSNKDILNVINLIGMQICMLHGYDEVKLAFLGRKNDIENLSYLKDVNHIWDNGKGRRYLATKEDSARELVSELNKMAFSRREQEKDKQDTYMIVIITDRSLAKSVAFSEINEDVKDDKIRVIYAYDDGGELPRECETIVKFNVSTGLIYGKGIEKTDGIRFTQDILNADECKKAVQKLFGYKLNLKGGENNLPKVYEFMEMFKAGKTEHLNILHRWSNSNPIQTLKTEIGIDTNGDMFYLDIHERAHGPHGLVAGMTGSGKSEFIISYILSMAINYSPDEVAFVLIDYKGGGLADAFQKKNKESYSNEDGYVLPHLVGTITNIDSGAVYRNMLAINSELKRRQKIFKEVKQQFDEATMDIYKYQKLFRAGQVEEPMPHLIIIADEFAELISQQSDFMDDLISTARIGRSLGVHLILATQKPSGVVNDQIWANSKFKVCLKVQDKSDSVEMLKSPEAADLTDIGRFYLQVGYNELFMLGQSAWSGALYPDTDVYVNKTEKDIEIIDELGNTIEKLKYYNNDATKNNREQIVEIVKYLSDIAKGFEYEQRQLWCPELPRHVDMHELMHESMSNNEMKGRDKLWGIAGKLDDPYTQSQRMLTVDFEEKGNAIVYGNSTSGMDMFVETVLFSMFEMYSPEEFNTYILDFENDKLMKFANIPHVGDVLRDGDDEKISNFYLMIREEIKKRRTILSEFGGNINTYNRTATEKLPKILVVINNYAHFTESYEKLGERNIALTRDGMKYGIYFMITGATAGSIGYRISQNFAQSFVLQLNESTDYMAILGNIGKQVPEKYVGRGVIRDKDIYMFQTAEYLRVNDKEATSDVVEKENAFIELFCQSSREKYGNTRARKVPHMPKKLTAESFGEMSITYDKVPIGISYEKKEPLCINFAKRPLLGVTSKQLEDVNRFMVEFVKVLSRIDGAKVKVLNGDKNVVFDGVGENVQVYSDVNVGANEIFDICKKRIEDTGDMANEENQPEFVVIHSWERLKEILERESYLKLENNLKYFRKTKQVFFIVSDDNRLCNNNSTQSWHQKGAMENTVCIGKEANKMANGVYNREGDVMPPVNEMSGYYCRAGKPFYAKFVATDKEESEDDE